MIFRKIQLLILLISFSFVSLAQKKEQTQSFFQYQGKSGKNARQSNHTNWSCIISIF